MTIASNGNVGIGRIDPSKTLDVSGNTRIIGDFDVSGNISLNKEKNITSVLGNSAVGYIPESGGAYDGNASFAHYSNNDGANFALLQNADGATLLNASSDQNLSFALGGSPKMTIFNSTRQCRYWNDDS